MNAATTNIAPSTEARTFLERKHQLLIDGQWVAAVSGETTEIFDPATEQHLATVAAGGKADIDRAVAAARKALRGEWSKLTSYDRTRLILKLADELEANIGLASEIETLDNGMPRMVAHYSIASFGCDFLRYYAGWATKISGETIPVSPQGVRNGDSLTYTRREPIGVVGAIIPWNAPLIMATLKLGPALAAGCRHCFSATSSSASAFPMASSTSSPAMARRRAPHSPPTRMSTRSPSPAQPR